LNLYSVWRLDAANATLAKGLVYKAIFAETYGLSGKGCFDLNYAPIDAEADSGYGAGDWDIHQSAELTKLTGIPVVEDDHKAEFGTAPAPLRCDGATLSAGTPAPSGFIWTARRRLIPGRVQTGRPMRC
jgi:hypothetical protein